MRQTILQAAVKIPILNVKHLIASILHMTQKRDIQRGGPKRNLIRDFGLPKDGFERKRKFNKYNIVIIVNLI